MLQVATDKGNFIFPFTMKIKCGKIFKVCHIGRIDYIFLIMIDRFRVEIRIFLPRQ